MKNLIKYPQAVWADELPSEQWKVYSAVMKSANARQIPFALTGAFALSAYTQHWRNTKDLDLCIFPRDRQRMIEVVTGVGMIDYFDQKPYDREWIYRGILDGVIVDVIWAMANQRAQTEESWFDGGCLVEARGIRMRVVAPEVVLWDKLYILQRDRADWPDALNLLEAMGDHLNWHEILTWVGDDAPLLSGLLSVFGWLSPARARGIPAWVWRRLGIPIPGQEGEAPFNEHHVRLLDSRPWFFRHDATRVDEAA
jgi:hypothetical protein